MIKFKEHEGKLFRMLEEPVPLKEDDENVLVRFITHGIIGEYVMGHWLDCNQENVPIYVEDVDSYGDVTVWIENGNEHICCPFPMFQIIGTFVKEGSAEWALYQMMQGKMVCHKTSRWDWYRMYNDHAIQNRTAGCMPRVSAWLESTVQSGWQIYTEPKPESENIIHGHIPADMHLKYFHLCKFKVGDWVEWCGDQYMVESAPPQSGGRYDIRSPYDELGCSVSPENITRKLSPSEVITHIGCLSGTIAKSSDPNYFLMLHSRPITDRNYSMIRFSAIDATTRKIVEGLLRAQEEEK